MNKLTSDTISFLRFPLCCGIVLIHLTFGHPELLAFDYVHYFLSGEYGDLCLSLFFLISGFLFFSNNEKFDKTTYFRKLKSRFWTLLIPYVFWNLLVFVRLYLSQNFFLNLLDNPSAWLNDCNIFQLIFPIKGISPICYQFWFIRQLIIFSIASPIIYLAVKYLKLPLIAIIFLLWVSCSVIFLQSIEFRGLFFFVFGAWLAIEKINFLPALTERRKILLLVYLIFIILSLVTREQTIHRLSIFIGIPTLVAFTANGLKENLLHTNAFLSSASFYIYAYHGSLAPILAKAFTRYLPLQNNLTIIVAYLFSEIFLILLGLTLFFLLRKYFPKFTSIICGSR